MRFHWICQSVFLHFVTAASDSCQAALRLTSFVKVWVTRYASSALQNGSPFGQPAQIRTAACGPGVACRGTKHVSVGPFSDFRMTVGKGNAASVIVVARRIIHPLQ